MASDGEAGGAPRPGDPRSRGPRPGARPADLAWAALAAGLLVITATQFVMLAVALIGMETALSGGGMFVGFLVTVLWLLMVSWFVLGAWRRTVWGCPFDHVTTASAERRCPRHEAVATLPDPPS